MDRYIAALHEIVTRGLNSNSYKFALWRALVNLAPTTDERNPTISKDDLSRPFLGYYWPLEVKFHIRQGIDPDKDPIVMVLIRELVRAGKIAPGEGITDFQRRMPEAYERPRKQVSRKAFDDVIPRFHTIHGTPTHPVIFTFTGKVGKAGDDVALTGAGRNGIPGICRATLKDSTIRLSQTAPSYGCKKFLSRVP